MWKSAVITVSFFVINGGTLNAQELGGKDCFSITVPHPVSTQFAPGTAIFGLIGSILINRCTGQTWMLVKSTKKVPLHTGVFPCPQRMAKPCGPIILNGTRIARHRLLTKPGPLARTSEGSERLGASAAGDRRAHGGFSAGPTMLIDPAPAFAFPNGDPCGRD